MMSAKRIFIVESVLGNRESGTALIEQAVLFRTSHHSAMLEIELARRNIPFIKFGGLRFVETAHIKDVLAVLRWAENPTDRVTVFRVVQMLDGIGPKTAGRFLDSIAGRSPSEALAAFLPPAKAACAWRDLVELMLRLHGEGADWPAQLDLVRRWYQPHLERRYPDTVIRIGDLDQLQRIAAGYPSRTRFLTDLTLDPPDATSDQAGAPLLDDDHLILSTIHSAKGQEWKSVFVLNVVDGCIPSEKSAGNADDIEEERRLLYVAMTRAKDELSLIVPHRLYPHGQSRSDNHLYALRSRFIPASIVGAFDERSWLPLARRGHSVRRSGGVAVDLTARMRGRWRDIGT
jgi:DNA helicase-2/ATP-dependent DNA helicase PcrA